MDSQRQTDNDCFALYLLRPRFDEQTIDVEGPFSDDGRVVVECEEAVAVSGGPEEVVSASRVRHGIVRFHRRRSGRIPDLVFGNVIVVGPRFMSAAAGLSIASEVQFLPVDLASAQTGHIAGWHWMFSRSPRTLPLDLPIPDLFAADTMDWFCSQEFRLAAGRKRINGARFIPIGPKSAAGDDAL